MLVLGVETSCDETAAAVVEDGRRVRAERRRVADRDARAVRRRRPRGRLAPARRDHRPGPRARGRRRGRAFRDLDAIAVTAGPGLVGALLVGVETAKALAFALGKPLVAVNHLAGHLAAAFLENPPAPHAPPPYPHLALLVSGGHTALIRIDAPGQTRLLGSTRDDASGEAFDKVGKMLGLGYPGGVAIDKRAATGDPRAVALPRALAGRDDLDFSFSGLKTAVATLLARRALPEGQEMNDFCASFQAAVVDVLVRKSRRALALQGLTALVVCGGVAANRGLRAALARRPPGRRLRAAHPAAQVLHRQRRDDRRRGNAAASRAGARAGLDLSVDPGLPL